jgi:hypothetical protein
MNSLILMISGPSCSWMLYLPFGNVGISSIISAYESFSDKLSGPMSWLWYLPMNFA